MKKILVTGSNGYIGQHLVKSLQTQGYYVVGLDRVDRGVNIGDEFIHQNILDAKQINGKYDAVVHLAALVQVGGGEKAMMDYYRTNAVGTMNMLERVDYDNFIFASTCQASEFGNVYGQSKHIAEMTVRQYCELNYKNYTIFEFGNVAGHSGFAPTNPDGLMYNLIKARETGVFYVYGDNYDTIDGTADRDYVHVLEICHSIQKAIEKPSCVVGAEEQTYYEYLGHAKFYTVLECVEAFKKANNCDFEVVMRPRRIGDPSQMLGCEVSPYMSLNVFTLEEMMKV